MIILFLFNLSKLIKKTILALSSKNGMERNFITPVRAMNDFFLKPSDLEILRKTRRRSPYESEPPITVKQFLKIYNW